MLRYAEAYEMAIRLHIQQPSRSAADIRRELDDELGAGKVPTGRAVLDWLGEFKRDQSEPWTLADDETGEDAALILPILGEMAVKYGNNLPALTRNEARWLARIARALEHASSPPSPWLIHYWAVRYAAGGDTSDLDLLLALHAANRYEAARAAREAEDALERRTRPTDARLDSIGGT